MDTLVPVGDTTAIENAINEAFHCARCDITPAWYMNCARCHRNDALLCHGHLKFDQETITHRIMCGVCEQRGFLDEVFTWEPL